MPDKSRILYDAVSKDYDLGTFDEFKAKLKDPKKRKAFHDGVGKEYELGDYKTFEAKVGYGQPAPKPKPEKGWWEKTKEVASDVVNGVTGESYSNLPAHFLAEIAKSGEQMLENTSRAESNRLKASANNKGGFGNAIKNAFTPSKGNETNPDNLATQYFKKVLPVGGEVVKKALNPLKTITKDIPEGISDLASSKDSKLKTAQSLAKNADYWQGRITNMDEWQKTHNVPQNWFTGATKAVGGMLPDIALANAVGGVRGGRASQVAGKAIEKVVKSAVKKAPKAVAKYAPKIAKAIGDGMTSDFTKVLTAKGMAEGMAHNEENPELGGVVGAIKGNLEGTGMHVAGEAGAKLVGEPVAKLLGKTGMASSTSVPVANTVANVAVFPAIKTATTLATEGRLPTGSEIGQEVGTGLAFGAMHFGATGKAHKEVQNKAREILNADESVALKKVLNSTPEERSAFMDELSPIDLRPTDEVLKEIDAETNVEVKNDIFLREAVKKDKADFKNSIQKIVDNKAEIIDEINTSTELTPEQKSLSLGKVDEIYNQFSPVAQAKQSTSAKVKTARARKAKAVETEKSHQDDPIKQAEAKVEAKQADEEIKQAENELVNLVSFENSPVAKLKGGETFKTIDGTDHSAITVDLAKGEVLTATGETISLNEVDADTIKRKKSNTTSKNAKSEVDYTTKTDDELAQMSKRGFMGGLDYPEIYAIKREVKRRSREKVTNVPAQDGLTELSGITTNENVSRKDAEATKSVLEKYVEPEKLSDEYLVADFKSAFTKLSKSATSKLNPYANEAQLNNSVKEYVRRGLDGKELVKMATEELTKLGYNEKQIAEKLEKVSALVPAEKPVEAVVEKPVEVAKKKPEPKLKPLVTEKATESLSGIKTEVKPEIVPDKVQNPDDVFTISNADISRIANPTTKSLLPKDKLASHEQIVKQKFQQLSSFSGEEFTAKAKEFVELIHKKRANGNLADASRLNHWVDSIERLVASKNDISVSQAINAVTKMRSDWAKSRDAENGGKILDKYRKEFDLLPKEAESAPKTEEIAKVEEKPVVETKEPVKAKKEPKPKVEKPVEKVVEEVELEEEAEPVKKRIVEEEPEIQEPKKLSKEDKQFETPEVPKGKRNVLNEEGEAVVVNEADYERYERLRSAVDKKHDAIDKARSEGDTETIKKKRAELDAVLKTLRQLEADGKKKLSKLDKAEALGDKMVKDGVQSIKKGFKNMNDVTTASGKAITDASKIIGGLAIKYGVKSFKTLRDLVRMLEVGLKAKNITQKEYDDVKAIIELDKVALKNVIQLTNSNVTANERKKLNSSFGKQLRERFKTEETSIEKSLKRNVVNITAEARRLGWDKIGNLSNALKKDGKFYNPKDVVPQFTFGEKIGRALTGSTSVAETYGEKANRALKSMPGEYSKANEFYTEVWEKMYRGDKVLSKDEQKLLAEYIRNKRIIELDEKSLATGEKLKKHTMHKDNIDTAKEFITQFETGKLDTFKDFDADVIKKSADIYFKALKDLVQYRFDNGLINKGAYDSLMGVEFYSPTVYLEKLMGKDRLGLDERTRVLDGGIRKLVGGTEESAMVTNPAKLLADATNAVYEEVGRTKVRKAVWDLLNASTGKKNDWGYVATYTKKFADKMKEEYNNRATVPNYKPKFIKPEFKPAPDGYKLQHFKDGGNDKAFYIKDELARELNDRGEGYIGRNFARAIGGSALTTKLATGANWYFALSNPIRDAMFNVFTTDHYSNFLPLATAQYTKDFALSLKDSWTKKGKYEEFIEHGGGRDRMLQEQKLASGSEGKNYVFKKAWDAILHKIPELSESAGRLAVQRRAYKNLVKEAKKQNIAITPELEKTFKDRAAFSASQTIDFNQGGKASKVANDFLPFFNAGVIAGRNTVRYARDNKLATASKALQIVAMTAGLSMWNNGVLDKDEDGVFEEMGKYYRQRISTRDKASYYVIMLPFKYKDEDGESRFPLIRIPKSQDQIMLTTAGEYIGAKSGGVEGYDLKGYIKNRAYTDATGLFSPVDAIGNQNPWTKAITAYKNNKNDFTGEKFAYNFEKVKPNKERSNKTPDFFYDIAEHTGLSAPRLYGALSSAIPTNNQFFDIADKAHEMAFGSANSASERMRQEKGGTYFKNLYDFAKGQKGTDEEKGAFAKFMVHDFLTRTPALNRFFKETSTSDVSDDLDDIVKDARGEKLDFDADFEEKLNRNINGDKSITDKDVVMSAIKLAPNEPMANAEARLKRFKSKHNLKNLSATTRKILNISISSEERGRALAHAVKSAVSKEEKERLYNDIKNGAYTEKVLIVFVREMNKQKK